MNMIRIQIPNFIHHYYKKSPYHAGPNYFNLLPNQIKKCENVRTFKIEIKKYLEIARFIIDIHVNDHLWIF